MSSLTNASTANLFQTTGGLPTSSDTLPSVILLCAYAALVPLLLWRVASRNSRTKILIRPFIFVIARLVTWGIRIVLSKRTSPASTTVYIVEAVLISIGLVFLNEPLVALLKYLVGPYANSQDFLLNQGFTVLKLAILASIGIGVASGTMSGKANDLGTVKTLRTVSAIIALAILAVSTLIVFKAKAVGAPSRPIMWLAPVILCMLIADVFKLIQSLDHDQSSIVNKKATFYILLTIPEWIVAALYAVVNLVVLFDIDVGVAFEPVKDQQGGPAAGPGFGGFGGGRRGRRGGRRGLIGSLMEMGGVGQGQPQYAQGQYPQSQYPQPYGDSYAQSKPY